MDAPTAPTSTPLALLPHLDADDAQRVLDAINYLNVKEYRGFCDAHGIPYRIRLRTARGTRATSDLDRKDIVLGRVRHYLKTGEILPQTVYPASIVAPGPIPDALTPEDRLYYGWYDKKNAAVMGVLAEVTDGAYRNSSIARVAMKALWARGVAPTFAEFADAWQVAVGDYAGPSPEYAFLSDLRRGDAGPGWRDKRTERAAWVLRQLEAAHPPEV